MIGRKIGPYEVVSEIGRGGMGEVYRARDTKLDRDVAIKVLPESFASDPERLARFEREAKTLATLNHQNIAHVYDAGRARVEGSDSRSLDVAYLVMEFVDGEDLSTTIARGATPAAASLPIVRQIVDALEAAHDAGVIHRDLKPANIKVRADGAVKVLDFGLAKLVSAGTEDSGSRQPVSAGSATMTSPAVTGLGVILGTATYMAPEQARGRPVDKRADIWAFGTVWFELLTGRAPFAGDTITDVIAAVVTKEPDWKQLPADTPPLVRQLLARCLEKEPKQRLRDIGEVRLALAGNALETRASGTATSAPSRLASLGWIAAGILLVLLGAAVFWPRAEAPAAPVAGVIKYDVVPPGKAALRLDSRPALDISADGSMIVFAATEEGITRLYLRRRGETDIRPLQGTEGGSNPVFSPDGKSLAFTTRTDLMRMPLDGAPVLLTKLGDSRGIAWLDNAHIVFSPDSVTSLSVISIAGGEIKALTTLDRKSDDRTHRWPAVVPGGKAVLFTVGKLSSPDNYDDSRIDAVIVATGERRKVMEGASFVRIGPDGMLFYAKGGTVSAVPFDSERLASVGTAVSILHGVSTDTTTGAAHAAFGLDGTVSYIPGGTSTVDRQVFWVDKKGTATLITALPPGLYNDLRISPDGSRIAILLGSTGSGDVWIYDTRSTAFQRFTLDQVNGSPAWSRNGKMLYYASIKGDGNLTTFFKRPIDKSQEAVALGSVKSRAYLDALDPAEKIIYLNQYDSKTRANVQLAALAVDGAATVLTPAGFNSYASAISADGRWLAYQSDESSRPEVWVRDLKSSGARFQVSTTGGEEPHWSIDGKEIYYRDDTRLMSAAVTLTPEFRSNPPTVLFDGIYNLRSETGMTYDIDPVTGRFAMLRPAGQTPGGPTPRVRLIVNWLEEFKRTQSAGSGK